MSCNFIFIIFNNFQRGKENFLGADKKTRFSQTQAVFYYVLPDSANGPFLNQINSLYTIIHKFLSTEFSNIIVLLLQLLCRAFPNFQLSSSPDLTPLQARQRNGTRSSATQSGSVGPPLIRVVTKTKGHWETQVLTFLYSWYGVIERRIETVYKLISKDKIYYKI